MIRVFISYSHKDKALVEKLHEVIVEAGMFPLWSRNLIPGQGFDENIMKFIEYAHVFMPVLSKSSSLWVQQEIGYAIAHHIPVYPVTTDEINPKGMLQMIHAIKVSDDINMLKDQLNREVFQRIPENHHSRSVFRRAAFVDERAAMMKEYADNLRHFNEYGIVRQKGGLSSFHIPAEPIFDQKWTDRYDPEIRSENHKENQRGERLALQKHADVAGCRLIINPGYAMKGRTKTASRTRLQEIIDFLKNMPDEKVGIAIEDKSTNVESLTIVGDWFLAESVSFRMGDGFTNTFFTRNAAEITKRIEDFDHELNSLIRSRGWTINNSRKNTIGELSKVINSLDINIE